MAHTPEHSSPELPAATERAVMDTPHQSPGLEGTSKKSSMAKITEPVTGIKFKLMMLSLTLASLLIFLDTSIVSTASRQFPRNANLKKLIICLLQAVPQITDEFHSLSDIGWYGSAYQLGRYCSSLQCRSM